MGFDKSGTSSLAKRMKSKVKSIDPTLRPAKPQNLIDTKTNYGGMTADSAEDIVVLK